MRRGVCILAVLLLGLVTAAAASADEATVPTTTTAPAATTTTTTAAATTAPTTTEAATTTAPTTAPTTTAPTTTAPTTTAPTTTAPTTAVATTTTGTATTPTTTATAPTTTAPTTARPPARAPRRPSVAVHYASASTTALGSRCRSSGAAAIVAPRGTALAVGAAPARLGAARYGAVVRFRSARASGGSCRPGRVSIRSLSLFGGAVTADSVVAKRGRADVTDLRVWGVGVVLAPGNSVPLGTWGRLTADVRIGRTLAAPLALRLLEPHANLPAGTLVLVGYSGKAAPARATAHPAAAPLRKHAQRKKAKPHRHKRHRRHGHRPLKATPPLGLTGFVFPVSGGAAFADTYGGPRSDISNGWHHGDDLFAALGTPVVAVASGKLSLVGWEKLGGWRLWLTDAKGNQYYYAHLAAYSPRALHHRRVRAGQVLGFLGRTGDAFTTPPHLHFEIHPRGLLRLDYDGAVDPTGYLRRWRVEHARHVPRPLLPHRRPKGTPAAEAKVVWRQLLVARGLERKPSPPPPAPAPTPLHRAPEGDGVPASSAAAAPAFVRASASPRPPGGHAPPFVVALALGVAAAVASALSSAVLRRRAWATRTASARRAIHRRWRGC